MLRYIGLQLIENNSILESYETQTFEIQSCPSVRLEFCCVLFQEEKKKGESKNFFIIDCMTLTSDLCVSVQGVLLFVFDCQILHKLA